MRRVFALLAALSAAALAFGAAAAEAVQIVIDHNAFTPETLSVREGSTVRWINRDSVPHVIILGDDIHSPVLAPGESFEWTFSRAGTYEYGCAIHPGMRAELAVEKN